ncbi:PEP-dependent dihydroxyacetone kinase, ADP-binding subunit DhaL [bioreactor metagenome]|uniref:PEP-dependent dihydroxyacetone kinase, ADP-binding subunit DhaL n=1 Tax=bioreactor metagenome TaxID=1076179 RepID=A0A644YRD6_9ZZZZ
MTVSDIKGAVTCISGVMNENKDYLISLDQQNGDGDLGISMSCGFLAVTEYLSSASEEDLGKLLMKCSSAFNESAPSSLGTILSFGMIGMAKALKGKTDASLAELAGAMDAGVRLIMEKAGSKPGEKTVLDALCPAVDALKANSRTACKEAFSLAAKAAAAGSERTKEMRSVHGRAAYYGDKSIGLLDGGSVVGKLIFEGIETYCASR